MIPVIWQNYDKGSPKRGYWDQGFLELLFEGKIWKTPFWFEFKHYNDLQELPKDTEGAIIVLPARYNAGQEKRLNNDIKRLKWVLLIIGGDEENVFAWEKIEHPRIKIWVMTPNPKRHKVDFVLGEGFRKEAPDLIKNLDKTLDVFFCGQITHERRQLCKEKLETLEVKKECIYNDSFAQETITAKEYYEKMSQTKVVPCPSGTVTPSSFRVFEALEAGAVPVVDSKTPNGSFPDNYWEFLFENPPFPIFKDYEQLPGYIMDTLEHYPEINNKVFSWWQGYKRQVAYKLTDHIIELSGQKEFETLRDLITVVVCSSPIKSHPDTSMIEKTIADVRVQLPECEILLMLDKDRPEYQKWHDNYQEYIRRIIGLCNKWENVLPVVFEEFGHQSGNTKAILELVRTPLMLFVEHDAPLTPDCKIEWQELSQAILCGEANVIRFHHESHILDGHKHLMIGEPQEVCGTRMTKTIQWSQRPHLASVAYYRRMVEDYFSKDAKTMIEDVMHGKVISDYQKDGLSGWFNHRVWIYTPEGNIKRSYHTDGRGSEQKYSMKF